MLLSAPPDRVYRAWTEPEQFIKWFRGSREGRLEIQKFECWEGGRYDVTMITPNGDRLNLTGRYVSLQPDRKLVITWQWDFAPAGSDPTTVTVDIEPIDTGTRLVVTHDGFPNSNVRDRHESGWRPSLSMLGEMLACRDK